MSHSIGDAITALYEPSPPLYFQCVSSDTPWVKDSRHYLELSLDTERVSNSYRYNRRVYVYGTHIPYTL